MEIKPVKNAGEPNYPRKYDINGETISNSVPKRWGSSAAAKAALAALAAFTLTGCTPQIPTAGVPLPPSATSEASFSTPDVSIFAGIPAPSKVNVAPLFEHGDGRGAFGCVMIAPPVFLSEEDALAVINEAAAQFGLSFSAENAPEFSNIRRPVTDLNPTGGGACAQPDSTDNITSFKTDYADSQHGIAIEFVSTEDVKEWSNGPSGATVEEYYTKDAADQLSDAFEEASYAGFNTVAVLYDPCEFLESEEEARALSEADLKAQANDFFNWLKTQGII